MLKQSNYEKIIKTRGTEYYNQGKVGPVYIIENNYFAQVNKYTTGIGKDYNYCSCPFESLCKHLFALQLKIKEKSHIQIKNKINEMTKEELEKSFLNLMMSDPEIIFKFFKQTNELKRPLETLMNKIEKKVKFLVACLTGEFSSEISDNYVKYDKEDRYHQELLKIDTKLLETLKNSAETNKSCILEKLKSLNTALDNQDLVTYFEKTIKYLEDSSTK